MFLDASVIVAILAREPGWEEIVKRMEGVGNEFLFSPLVRFEAVLGLARAFNPAPEHRNRALQSARTAVEEFFAEIDCREVTVSSEIGDIALDAALAYGKAVGHPADLNFGDCFSYACAKAESVALMYKGDDFALTDLA